MYTPNEYAKLLYIMGASLTSLFQNGAGGISYLKVVLAAASIPVLASALYMRLLREEEPGMIELSYDEDDDLDERTVIAILDAHFRMGRVQSIKEEFNKRRRTILI